MSAAPPGWYPYGAGQGYWDGTRWTQALPAAPPPAATSPLPTTPYDAPVTPAHAPYPPPSSPYGAGPYGAGQYGGGYPTPYAVAPKNPALMVLASFFLPGLGTLLNGDTRRGVLILVSYLVSCALTLVLIGFLGMFGFWVWGMVDAYQGARRWNARHGILS